MLLQQLIVTDRVEIISAVTDFEIQFPCTKSLLSGFIPVKVNTTHLILFFSSLACQEPAIRIL
jgi:hypothetical protein